MLRSVNTNTTIVGGKGNDVITLDSSTKNNVIQYEDGDGNDIFVYSGGNDVITDYNPGEDKIKISSGTITKTEYNGQDIIFTIGSGTLTVKNGNGKNITVIDAEGNEVTELFTDAIPEYKLPEGISVDGTILKISSEVQGSQIDLNDYQEITTADFSSLSKSISILGSEETNLILGGSGNDTITCGINTTVNSGTGNNVLYGSSGKNVFIYGGGNDSIYNLTDGDEVSVGEEYSIEIIDTDVVIQTNKGKITIKDSYDKKFSIHGAKIDPIIVTNTKDSMTVNDGEASSYLKNLGNYVNYNLGTGNDSIYNFGDNVSILGYMGNNYIVNGDYNKTVSHVSINSGMGEDKIFDCLSEYSEIFGGPSADTIFTDGKYASIDGSYAGDSIVGFGNYDTLYGGYGDDTLEGNFFNSYVDGGANNDKIILYGYSNTIIGGADDDIITMSNNSRNNLIKYSFGDGNDTIIGIKSSDTLQITGGEYSTIRNGKDLKVNIGSNSILIEDDADVEFKIEGTLENENPVWTINGTTAIYGTGNDTLVTVTGLKNGLSVKDGTIEGISIKDNVVMVSSNIIGDDEVKIVGGGYTLEIVKIAPIPDGVSIKNNVLTASNTFTEETINLNEEWAKNVSKINTSTVSRNISIIGNTVGTSITAGKGADTIFAGLGNDTLTGGKGNDVFVYVGGKDLITDYKSGEDQINLNFDDVTKSTVKGSDVILTTNEGTLTIKGTKDKIVTFVDDNGTTTEKIFFTDISYTPLETGLTYDSKRTVLTASNKFKDNEIDLNDYLSTVTKLNTSALSQAVNIIGNENNNSIKGGKGADTISGGLGKNTLTGGAGKDVFIYTSGNDVITDYKAGEDSIKIDGTISGTSYKGKDVIFKVGDGTLTVKNSKGNEISVTDSSGKTQTYAKTLDLLYDNNFLADEFGIDDISEVTETNYSVGQIEYSNNNNELVNTSIVSASFSDEK